MTNREAYLDKIFAKFIDNYCHKIYEIHFGKKCHGSDCFDCKFCNVETISAWLKEEYREPEPELLENGDGLKPGDWIMVRDNSGDEWVKRQFMCYLDGSYLPFVASDCTVSCGIHSSWGQARLPEDGE